MATATRTGVSTYTTPSDRELVITRLVDAPRRLVFDAWTDPRHIPQWLLGPDGWTMPVCEMDLRPGGSWRYVWRKDDGCEMAMSGEVRDVVRPERLVTTERWGPEWPETVNTVMFTEAAGKTTITLTILYPSKEARDAAMATGMADGIDQSFARLDRLVRAQGAAKG
jgi:uncharacterized protein YndB with AHSA1/START domain